MIGSVGSPGGINSPSAAQFQKLFKKLDANGDGSIDKSEFESALKSSAPNAAAGANINKIFSAIDTNGDGKISDGEFSVFATKMTQKSNDAKSAGSGGKGAPEGVPRGGGQKSSSSAGSSGAAPSSSSTSQTFDPMDTNQDGVVSLQEEMAYALAHPDPGKSMASQSGSPLSSYNAAGMGGVQKFSSLLNVLV